MSARSALQNKEKNLDNVIVFGQQKRTNEAEFKKIQKWKRDDLTLQELAFDKI